MVDLGLRRRWDKALTVAAMAGAIVTPWLYWMASMGSVANTQAGLLVNTDWSWAERIYRPFIFYGQRIPDQLFGPFAEVGTAPGRNLGVVVAANLCAFFFTALIVAGWLRLLKDPRRRLAALVPLASLAILGPWPYTEAGRFLTPLIPFLLFGMVEGIQGLVRQLLRPCAIRARPGRIRLISACLVLGLSLPYTCYAVASARSHALEASHREFDAACEWIATHAERPGPVISRHPGEVFWRTGREGLEVSGSEQASDNATDERAIARLIMESQAAYLLVDEGRYLRALPSPLTRFVARNPERVREVFKVTTDRNSVAVYEIRFEP